MGHTHHHHTNNLKLAFWLNFGFSLLEFAGGIYSGSIAILSDAFHDFGDAVAIGSAYFLERFSLKKNNNTYTYGYRRFSLLSAVFNNTILFLGSCFIIYKSIPMLANPDEVRSEAMFVFAIIGLAVNGFAMYKLSDHGGHLNQKTVFLHLMEDVMGWTAILIGSVFIYYFGWHILDPILSLLIAGFILYNATTNLASTYKILMQAVPDQVSVSNITRDVTAMENVEEVNNLEVWTMDGEYMVATIHVTISAGSTLETMQTTKEAIRKALTHHHINYSTIEINQGNPD